MADFFGEPSHREPKEPSLWSRVDPFDDYYAILSVPHGAHPAIIRKAYRRLALITHPDKVGSAGRERFERIQTAYEILLH
jgi:curved DNA-binding protein CbpA